MEDSGTGQIEKSSSWKGFGQGESWWSEKWYEWGGRSQQGPVITAGFHDCDVWQGKGGAD